VTLALLVGIVLVALVGGVRRWRRRTVYLRMSDTWLRDHVDDPLPEHLR
jgi:hypothetical protein